MRAACDAAGVALVPLVAPTTPDERLAAIGAPRARLRLHGLGDRHHRRARRPSTAAGRALLARAKAPQPGARRGRLRHLHARAGRRRGRRRRRRRDRRLAARARGAEAADGGRGSRPRRSATLVAALAAGAAPRRLRAAMGVLLTLIAGLVVWVVLWAIGVKALRRLPDHARCCSCSPRPAHVLVCRTCPGNRRDALEPTPRTAAVRQIADSAVLRGSSVARGQGVRRIAPKSKPF